MSDCFHKEALLTSEQWQALAIHLSKPLDDAGKALILDLINLFDTFNALEKEIPTLTDAHLRKNLIQFKSLSQSLIPKPLTPLSEQSSEAMIKAFKQLPSDVKAHLSYPLFLMTRNTATEGLHPSQYYCAAIISLERLPTKKTLTNKKGAGRSDAGNKQIYKRIWRLWRDLGETNTKVTATDANISPLVAFTHELLAIAKTDNGFGYSSIRQNLAKYKKG